jgi:signal peptidase I
MSLRAIWFVVIPGLLTALALRYLVPTPVRAPAGAFRELARWALDQQVLLAVGFFFLFGSLLRYWRARLPAASSWADPPAQPGPNARATAIWTGLIVLAAASALLLRSSGFQSYRVLSGSMLPTLQPGDKVLSTQFAYGTRLPWRASPSQVAPRRGDVVVFRRPPIRPDVPEELIKRVIGLPGDTIATHAGFVTINDWKLPSCKVGPYVFIAGDGMLEGSVYMEYLEDRVYLTVHGPYDPEQYYPPYTVKPGEVFVLGDNRNNSSDSRAWNEGKGGGLRFEEIGGRADRFVSWAQRNGGSDLSPFLKEIRLQLRTEGIDDSALRAGIERCLAQRPKDTFPPRPGAAQPTAGL